ncbi:DUF4267 domain-containing protein [Corticibacterium sp. UT-5YL-CI-8]|nr:DUF4267 domain-containing protein [Tianweitania sp. UT-5YL-CI-8]
MGVALLVSIGIIAIGAMYLARPATAMRSFGLPLPAEGESTMWWLRLKGVRDVATGLLVLALMMRGDLQIVGVTLLVDALIPLGDMLLILGAKGSTRAALSIQGFTALLMAAAAVPLIAGLA